MDSILFLLFLIAVAIVVYWAWQNDKVPPDKPTTGWLRMRVSGLRDDQPSPAEGSDDPVGAGRRNRPRRGGAPPR